MRSDARRGILTRPFLHNERVGLLFPLGVLVQNHYMEKGRFLYL